MGTVGIIVNMMRELMNERFPIADNAFAELRILKVSSISGSSHGFKYSLALVIDGKCVLRYDNEAGKGDHRHRKGKETAYTFSTLQQLQVDFWNDVNKEFDK